MLTVGLTGGIGSGKSTVARRLAKLGARVIDADVIAREVLAPDSPGLAEVVERFGPAVVDSAGALDRPALAARVFGDAGAGADLEAITHPRIAERTSQLLAAAGDDEVVVHDVPLLVEKRMGPNYHLVVVVDAPVPVRLERLAATRGMSEADARARMEHQASPEARRAAADVVLDNAGSTDDLTVAVDALWRDRIAPYAANLAAGRVTRREDMPVVAPHDDRWADVAARLVERLSAVLGARAPEIEHVGSTSVPGMAAKDVVDLQVGVPRLPQADDPEFVAALAAAGFPRVDDLRMDHPVGELVEPDLWVKRFHGSSDPGRTVHLHVREIGGPGWDYALLFRDWLRACPDAAREYAQVKGRLVAEHGATAAYGRAKASWFEAAWPRMTAWAKKTGWRD